MKNSRKTGLFVPVLLAIAAAVPLAAAEKISIPLEVFEAGRLGAAGADRAAEGVSIGVPFTDGMAVKDNNGRPPLALEGVKEYQFRTLARWPGGNIRWAAVVFQTDCKAKQKADFTIVPGAGISGGKPLAAETDRAITVDTGAIAVTVRKEKFNLFDGVKAGGAEIVEPDAMDVEVVGPEGGTFLGSADGTAVIEENGPVRCVIRAKGSNRGKDGKRMLGYIVRMYFYRGRSDVRAYYTLTNDEDKENRDKVYLTSVNVVTRLAAPVASVRLTGRDKGEQPGEGRDIVFYMARPKGDYQRGSGKENMGWDKFGIKGDDTGYLMKKGDEELVRGKAEEVPDLMWVDAADEKGAGVTVGVRFARGNFPKTMRVRADGTIAVGLWPAESGVKHVIAHSSHATFEVLYDFHAKPAADPAGTMYRFQYPLTGRTTVAWYNRCTGDSEVYPLYHMVSRGEEEALAKQNSWVNRQAGRRRDMVVWRSWYWGRGGFRNQHDFARVAFVDFLRDDNIERAGAYFLYAEDRFNYNVDWSMQHGEGKTDFGRKHCIGRKINFEEEHVHWYGIPLYYYCTGDQRIGDAIVEFVRKFRADRSGPRMYGWARFLGWAMYLLAAGDDITGDKEFKEGITTHVTKIVHNETKWNMDWQRGAFGHGGTEWHTIPPEPPISMSARLMIGYIIHDSFWLARSRFGWDDPVGERLADICEGIEWIMERECFLTDDQGYYKDGKDVYGIYHYNLSGFPRGHKRGWGFIGPAHYSVMMPILRFGEEFSDGLAERVVRSSFASGLNESGFTYLDMPGCEALMYYLLHQKKQLDGSAPEAIKDLKAESLGGGKVKLSWTTPAGAAKFQARFSTRTMVPNLNWDRDKRVYEFHPDEYANWWAAEHLQGEPVPEPGKKQEFTADMTTGLRVPGQEFKPGTYLFAVRSWDATNHRSALSNQAKIEVK